MPPPSPADNKLTYPVFWKRFRKVFQHVCNKTPDVPLRNPAWKHYLVLNIGNSLCSLWLGDKLHSVKKSVFILLDPFNCFVNLYSITKFKEEKDGDSMGVKHLPLKPENLSLYPQNLGKSWTQLCTHPSSQSSYWDTAGGDRSIPGSLKATEPCVQINKRPSLKQDGRLTA